MATQICIQHGYTGYVAHAWVNDIGGGGRFCGWGVDGWGCDGSCSGCYGRFASITCSNAPSSAPCRWANGYIAHGASINVAQASWVGCGESCVWETRTCNNGVLSGSYTNTSCSVDSCSSGDGGDGGNNGGDGGN
jgi:hypothetical protein